MIDPGEFEGPSPSTSCTGHSTLEVLTPFKVTVVLIIRNHVKSRYKEGERGLKHRAQARGKFCVLLLKLIQLQDMSFPELCSVLCSDNYDTGDGFFAHFQRTMGKLASCGIEQILDLYDSENSIEKIISESTGVSQHGIIGLYVRKIMVAMEKMSFPEMMTLHNKLNFYHGKGMRLFNICPISTETRESHNYYDIRNSKLCVWSKKQAELFVSQQCCFLENNEEMAVIPSRLEANVNVIIEDIPLLSQVYFLSYLNSVRLRDVFASLDAIHRTFDRNLTYSLINAEMRGFQFSVLNLAIFHIVFKHKSAAEYCLRECAMLSKQAGDRHCLQHNNAWQCILKRDAAKLSVKSLPEASEVTYSRASSLSVQFIVKLAGVKGYKPAAVLHALVKSDELNCKNYMPELTINSIVERAAVWTLHGENVICSLYTQLLLQLNHASMFIQVFKNEAICKAFCMMSLFFCTQGEYAWAYVLIQNAKLRLRRPISKTTLLCESFLDHIEAIIKYKWSDSQNASGLLAAFNRTFALNQRVSTLISRGNLAVAFRISNGFKNGTDPLTYIRSLMLLSRYTPSSSFIAGLKITTLTTAMFKAREVGFRYEATIANMLFSHMLLGIGMLNQAKYTMQTSFETVNSNGSVYDKAKYSIFLAKSIISEAKTREDKLKMIKDCTIVINVAIESYKKLEAHSKVKDSYAYVALFFNNMGLMCQRNKYSLLFRQYDQNFPTPKEYLHKIF